MKGPLYFASFDLAIMIVRYCEELRAMKKFELSSQLLRSGTSVGANIREAQASESKRDFYHKLKISSKELLETEYWLEVIGAGYQIFPPNELTAKLSECKALLFRILETTRKNGL